MQINIENYLQKIDLSLNSKTKKDVYMIYIMLFMGIFSFSYLVFWDTSLQNFNKMNKQISSIEAKLFTDNIYLKNNTEAKISILEKKIKKVQMDLAIIKDKNSYIKNKVETISSLLYNEKTWGSYINSISQNAKKYNIKILTFTNEIAISHKSFGHMLDINLNFTGNYINTLSFINSLEQSELVVDLHALNIQAQDKLNTDLNISVWGINY
ncbi:MAG: hypothetical protein COB17_07370 [Sulfurimonas sp.]|nr:MAG: hypothetical protein COB17_07370 [Sulfurimonas sp.]